MNRRFNNISTYKNFSSKMIRQFANDKGYSYVGSKALESDESGYYMKPGYYNEKVDLVRWSENGVDYEFYTRWMGIESLEKMADSVEDSTRSRLLLGLVFSVKLPYRLPSVLVQSLTSKTIWNILGITQLFVGKKVKLEGDFNRYFNVYTPSGKASNAFLALAPDTMVKILRAGSGIDFQFAGDRIYFMYDQRVKLRNFRNFWGLAGDFSDIKLNKPLSVPQIDYDEWKMFYERSHEYSVDMLNAFRAVQSSIEEPELYYYNLTGKKLSLIVVIQIVCILFLLWVLFQNLYLLLVAIPLAIVWSIARYVYWRTRLKKLLKAWDDGRVTKVVR